MAISLQQTPARSGAAVTPPLGLAALALAIVAAGFSIMYWQVGAADLIGIDDANITMVYGRNLAAGHGYVYNPGEERVEGSTSILWTLIAALAYAVAPAPEPLLLLTCGLLTVWTVYLSLRLVLQAAPADPTTARLALTAHTLFLLGLPSFFAWNLMTLMDTALWTAALASLLYALVTAPERQRPAVPLAVAGALLVLARPEAMAVGPTLILGAMAVERCLGRPLARIGAHGIALAVMLATAACLAAIRLWYFGVPLPNTFYVKVGGTPGQNLEDGLRYLLDFAVNRPLGGLLLAAAAFVLVLAVIEFARGRRDGTDRRTVQALVGLAVVVVAVLPLISGGDHFYGYRMLQPVHHLLDLPIILRAGGRLRLPHWLRGRRLRELSLVAGGFALLAIASHTVFLPGRFAHEIAVAAAGRQTGQFLNGIADSDMPPPSIGIIAAGGLRLSYDGGAYDLLGLNWAAMAHAGRWRQVAHGHGGFDQATFWQADIPLVVPWKIVHERRPAPGPWVTARLRLIFDDIFHDPRFQAAYVPALAGDDRRTVLLLARRDWLARYSGPFRIEPLPWAFVLGPD